MTDNKDLSVNTDANVSRAEKRLQLLFDEGTLQIEKLGEVECLICGKGKINGRLTFAVSHDYTVKGGSVGKAETREMCNFLDKAKRVGAPFIFIMESAGARIQEGIDGLDGYGRLFNIITSASGRIPMLALVMGVCAGGAAYTAALCDIVIMNNESGKLFVTGSKVLKMATGEDSTNLELGASYVHARQSGVAHFCCDGDEACIEKAREVLSYIPQNCGKKPPVCKIYEEVPFCADVPRGFNKPYDIRDLVISLADKGTFRELQAEYAENVVTGWARIEGRCVGIIANQPKVLCGSLDIDASCKASRFIDFCDCFNIPILTLVDTPGFLPGKNQEQNGILRHGAKLLLAYSQATVPKITVIVRKAIGGAYIAMNSHGLGSDVILAWDNAKISVMDDSSGLAISEKAVNTRSELEYALESGIVTQSIHPFETRKKVSALFSSLGKKSRVSAKKKHVNSPL